MLSPEYPRRQMLTQQQRNNRRRRANPRQLAFLRKKFSEDPKPDQAEREKIGQAIDMTPRSVQIWFQNNRAKTKDQERKFSMHGKLFTRACSENVSCVQARGSDQPYATHGSYGSYGRSFSSPDYFRFMTPPPGPSPLLDGCSTEWWTRNSSLPSLSYGQPFSQQTARASRHNQGLYTKLLSRSVLDIQHSEPECVPTHGNTLTFLQRTVGSKEQQMLPSSYSPSESAMGLHSESPVSIMEPSPSESYVFDGHANSVPDLHGGDDIPNSETDFNIDISPKSVDPGWFTRAPVSEFLETPALESLELHAENEPYTYNSRNNNDPLETLVDALDLKLSNNPRTFDGDFTTIPCTLIRIGQYLSEDSTNLDHSVNVQYSPSRQELRITFIDTSKDRLTVLEKSVLQFPSSRDVQFSSFGYSHIDVEVFGSPKIRTEDHAGKPLEAYDPTNGEVVHAQQFRLFGDFGEQLAMTRKLEAGNSNLCVDWLLESNDTVALSQTLLSNDDLLSNNNDRENFLLQENSAALHASQNLHADSFFI